VQQKLFGPFLKATILICLFFWLFSVDLENGPQKKKHQQKFSRETNKNYCEIIIKFLIKSSDFGQVKKTFIVEDKRY
jgi:hypothetical protein